MIRRTLVAEGPNNCRERADNGWPCNPGGHYENVALVRARELRFPLLVREDLSDEEVLSSLRLAAAQLGLQASVLRIFPGWVDADLLQPGDRVLIVDRKQVQTGEYKS